MKTRKQFYVFPPVMVLALFSSVATLFWYVLQLLSLLSGRD